MEISNRGGGRSDDNLSLINKKSVLQTKYRPLFLKKQTKYRPLFLKLQTKFENVLEKSVKVGRATVSNAIVKGVYFDIIIVESNPIYSAFLNLNKRKKTH